MEPIRLYAPDRYREPKLYTHSELLFPFWGVTAKESMPYVRAASLQYQYSKNDFALVDRMQDADYVVLPYSYNRFKAVHPAKVAMIIREAKHAGKQIIIDGSGDSEHPIAVPHSIILRISQYAYKRQPNEITIPATAEDLLMSYAKGALHLREKSAKPSVSFTGWARVSIKTRLKLLVKELPLSLVMFADAKRGAQHKGILFRARVLEALSRNPRIEPHFTLRASYSGHMRTIQGAVADNRREFVENLLDSDYALCVKGDANYSVRFYEALSLGRIPLFLDTACVLPLEDIINYRDFCVFADWRDTDRIGDILADFHAKLSPEQFINMQKKARDAYAQYLRMDAFSAHLAAKLRKIKTRDCC